MRIAYLDCFSGISGDMMLGALLGAGVPLEVMQRAAGAMNLNASLRVSTVDRSGISSIKVDVFEGDRLAESPAGQGALHDPPAPSRDFEHQSSSPVGPHTPQLKTQHLHKTGHAHDHPHTHDELPHTHDEPAVASHTPHEHGHGRSLSVIREMIAKAALDAPVKALATRAFELLGASEAKIHNVPVDEIHFHEVGAVDAIIDIICASAGIVHLNIGAWHSSAINVGGGMVVCAHGTFPVPAPATADLLRNIPTYSAHVQKELVTPTGAALLRALNASFGPQPAMLVEQIGYGAGTRNPDGFPNVLRLSVGQAGSQSSALSDEATNGNVTEDVAILESAVDDSTPQVLAHVAEIVLAHGALDVMLTPVLMKKGRPGTLITILAEPAKSAEFADILFRELPTLGVRTRTEHRTVLQRKHVVATTTYGPIRIKLASHRGEQRNAMPEFEDCRTAALTHNVPLRQVQQAALQAFAASPQTDRQ